MGAHSNSQGQYPHPDIATLTRGLTEGNEMAFRMLHHTYAGRLSRYLLVVARGEEDAMRDALQETFRRIVRHVRVFHDEAIFWSWLTVVARTALADRQRKQRRYFAFLDRFTTYHTAVAESASPPTSDDPLHAQLTHCLAALPVDERALLEGKYFRHRSVAELAAEFNVSEKALESRLGRARQKIKCALLAALKHDDAAR